MVWLLRGGHVQPLVTSLSERKRSNFAFLIKKNLNFISVYNHTFTKSSYIFENFDDLDYLVLCFQSIMKISCAFYLKFLFIILKRFQFGKKTKIAFEATWRIKIINDFATTTNYESLASFLGRLLRKEAHLTG